MIKRTLILTLVSLIGCAQNNILASYHALEGGIGFTDSFFDVETGFEIYMQTYLPIEQSVMLSYYRASELCEYGFKSKTIETGYIVRVHSKDSRIPSYSKLKVKCTHTMEK